MSLGQEALNEKPWKAVTEPITKHKVRRTTSNEANVWMNYISKVQQKYKISNKTLLSLNKHCDHGSVVWFNLPRLLVFKYNL